MDTVDWWRIRRDSTRGHEDWSTNLCLRKYFMTAIAWANYLLTSSKLVPEKVLKKLKRMATWKKLFLCWQDFDTISQTVIHLSPHKLSSFFCMWHLMISWIKIKNANFLAWMAKWSRLLKNEMDDRPNLNFAGAEISIWQAKKWLLKIWSRHWKRLNSICHLF